jgi:predicted nucleic acid-binding protein
MKVYVDSSMVIARLLRTGGGGGHWSEWEAIVSSELLRVETYRVIDRLRIKNRLSDSAVARLAELAEAVMDRIERIRVNAAVLDRAAAPFPTAVHTLDAIHLASALLWMEERGDRLLFATHDRQLALAARACGMGTIGGR